MKHSAAFMREQKINGYSLKKITHLLSRIQNCSRILSKRAQRYSKNDARNKRNFCLAINQGRQLIDIIFRVNEQAQIIRSALDSKLVINRNRGIQKRTEYARKYADSLGKDLIGISKHVQKQVMHYEKEKEQQTGSSINRNLPAAVTSTAATGAFLKLSDPTMEPKTAACIGIGVGLAILFGAPIYKEMKKEEETSASNRNTLFTKYGWSETYYLP